MIVKLQGENAKTGTNSASGRTTPKICGVNTGSHLYIDAGPETTGEATLSAVLTGSTSRQWKIKASIVQRCPIDGITISRSHKYSVQLPTNQQQGVYNIILAQQEL